MSATQTFVIDKQLKEVSGKNVDDAINVFQRE